MDELNNFFKKYQNTLNYLYFSWVLALITFLASFLYFKLIFIK